MTPKRISGPAAGLAALVVVAATLAGCASSGKLARKSQEQLAEGEVRKAYQTSLKAVEKDPYNQEAVAALAAAGRAMEEHHARRFDALAARDTIAAAEVALTLADLRRQVAFYGVVLANDTKRLTAENLVRYAAAAQVVETGDAILADGDPKAAHRTYRRAERFDPESEDVARGLRESYEAALDHVLLLPYASDLRAPLDLETLSWDMFRSVSQRTDGHLEFTALAEPGPVWNRAFAAARGGFTRDAAMLIGHEREATRVAWGRIFGDRFESHTEVFETTVYRKVKMRTPEGGSETAWQEVPVRVRIQDLWASAALECEVHDLRERRLVARRTSDWGSGLRAVHVSRSLEGNGDDYALYTPEMWSADRAGCRARAREWTEALGDLTVEKLVVQSRSRTALVVPESATRYGATRRGTRSYSVCYGRVPAESALLQSALRDAWKELFAALEEADRV